MNKIDYQNKSVGELAASRPMSIHVYKQLGIDFCCGGGRPLMVALEEKGVLIEEFDRKLQSIEAERGTIGQIDFREMSSGQLSSYIEDTHHAFLRDQLPRESELLQMVLNAHGRAHRELFEVYRLFGQLKTDLEQHLLKEENLLFPALQDAPGEEDTRQLAIEIVEEHEAAGEILATLHRITGDFAIPEDACETYRIAYDLLNAIEQDINQHIHLENNILLKETIDDV
ncbi:MAG: iron-sulfur cluster repair di-iron protein [Clostridiaceae bacterium]|nr:iron-sulfur cluster repair di-iron protein [Clostridiaceae bacterium]